MFLAILPLAALISAIMPEGFSISRRDTEGCTVHRKRRLRICCQPNRSRFWQTKGVRNVGKMGRSPTYKIPSAPQPRI